MRATSLLDLAIDVGDAACCRVARRYRCQLARARTISAGRWRDYAWNPDTIGLRDGARGSCDAQTLLANELSSVTAA